MSKERNKRLQGFSLNLPHLFAGLTIFSSICLLFYSFTQVDLGLTLNRASILTQIQRSFQYIGYFDRPLSTYLYIGIIVLMFVSYGLALYLAAREKITYRLIWKLVFISSFILVLSYSAFSYDLFNYIFDAKILTHYHLNPYLYRALDFPGDKMLSFMHWTHRVYPYGPAWLLFTAPLSLLGMQLFIPTFFLFKALALGLYLGSVWSIAQIMRIIAPKKELMAIVFFAFNPLVIIETLVSGHNDIAMMFLLLVSILFLVQKKYIFAFFFLLLSIGIKYATGFLLPMYFLIFLFERQKVVIKWGTVFSIFLVTMTLALFAATLRTTFQPWYLMYVIPFAALIPDKKYIIYSVFLISLVGLLNYVPYLYTGNWDPPIPFYLLTLNLVGVVIALVIFIKVYLNKNNT